MLALAADVLLTRAQRRTKCLPYEHDGLPPCQHDSTFIAFETKNETLTLSEKRRDWHWGASGHTIILMLLFETLISHTLHQVKSALMVT